MSREAFETFRTALASFEEAKVAYARAFGWQEVPGIFDCWQQAPDGPRCTLNEVIRRLDKETCRQYRNWLVFRPSL